jgi:hypothetical protein
MVAGCSGGDASPPPVATSGVGGSGAGSSSSSGGNSSSGVGASPPQTECDAADPGGLTFDRIATWRDGATSAYSMIHDDMCGPALRGIDKNAVPALAARGLTAALGPIVDECEKADMWGVVKDAEAKGNEIVNHSYTHPEISVANAPKEVAEAKAGFEMHTSNPVSFYIFPYDYWTPETLQAVADAGHIGARAGNRDDNDGFDNPPINSAEPTADMEIEFDAWPRTYSKYALYKSSDMLDVHVHNAIERDGWAVREFHSVIDNGSNPEGQGFGPIELKDYEAHLDFLVDAWKANKVWTTNPSTAIKYRRARTACKASVEGTTIRYDASADDCQKFATPVSVIVKTANDVASLKASQGSDPVFTRKIAANTFSVTADPTKGDVSLEGCSNAGATVEDISLPAKPQPAESVCDLELVKGTGSPGMMDDLERPFEQFQVLPNPSQGDGRTGSWSWYPQNVTVEMMKDGGNTVLKYAGGGLSAWTGVTLAFLGGNGAGSCYDASAYQGIRFKIKGSVTSSDDLNGKVIMSLVTAETQGQTFGGDLDGSGGHFNKVVSVSSQWTTVSIKWTELGSPTWGDTLGLNAVAKAKLQAIDWGISDKASNFEVYLDDIELY